MTFPQWLVGWAAAGLLIAAMVFLTTRAPRPLLAGSAIRPLVPIPRGIEPLCAIAGVLVFGLLLARGLTTGDGDAPHAVAVWGGAALVSIVLGDLFRPFNPWRTLGALAARGVRRARPGWTYARLPERIGRWPAVAGLAAFGWLQLAVPGADRGTALAAFALLYCFVYVCGAVRYGPELWEERGDGFGSPLSLFARCSPFTVHRGQLSIRRPLHDVAAVRWLPGTDVLLCAAIGIAVFDAADEGRTWRRVAHEPQRWLESLSDAPSLSMAAISTLGLTAAVGAAWALFQYGIRGMRGIVRGKTARGLRATFAPTLIPIAAAYSAALPTVEIRTAAGAFWEVQIIVLTASHLLAQVVAHDRSLISFRDDRSAIRARYWMLGVVITFVTFGLWLALESHGAVPLTSLDAITAES